VLGLQATSCFKSLHALLHSRAAVVRSDTAKSGGLAAAPTLRILKLAVAILLSCAPLGTLRAQHAGDNPEAAADDAFGLTLGLETIGMYGPGSIRGFNPQIAGNVRIDGLYFDQQGGLSNRVVEGSTIRVGLSEIGYAFPAPTGIVDYDLRHAGDGTPSASIVASAGPFEGHGLSIDGSVPLISGVLQLPIGASYQETTSQTPVGSYPGYTAEVLNFGATPQWKLNDKISFRALFDWTQITHAKSMPVIFTAGDYLPPDITRGYIGQQWAQNRNLSENYGGLVDAKLTPHWTLTGGLFRSLSDNPVNYTDVYANTEPDGLAEHYLIGSPDQRVASNSGEVRLTGHFPQGGWSQDVVLLARGRDTWSAYGGSDVVDVGPAYIGQGLQITEPDFSYGARAVDHTELWSTGIAYQAQWPGHGDMALGIQRESYDKEVTSPGEPVAQLTDNPLRAYGSIAAILTPWVTGYAGYTQGLEDSGVAPPTAENRGAILPAAQTWQTDAGLRFLLTPKVKLIAGVFEITKPYFNFDSGDVDRQLGLQRARGLELSLSGEVVSNLYVTAGALIGHVVIIGPDLAAEGVSHNAFGQARQQGVLNANYDFQHWSRVSADVTVVRAGATPAAVNDAIEAPAVTMLSLGARYRFTIHGSAATVRFSAQNVTNAFVWVTGYSPGYYEFAPRSIFGYLTWDV
jgi:iron complex outermembrane receptor protein